MHKTNNNFIRIIDVYRPIIFECATNIIVIVRNIYMYAIKHNKDEDIRDENFMSTYVGTVGTNYDDILDDGNTSS